MIWPDTFEKRLAEWSDVRTVASAQDLPDSLLTINDWWFRVPVVNHHLHRDDVNHWPDPWQLLDDNIYCDLARALGIVYTLMSIDRADIQDVSIICTENDNLVQVNQGLYILNWAPSTMLNNLSQDFKIRKTISREQLKHKYN